MIKGESDKQIERRRNEDILTAQEVCSYLKIPLSTLYGLSKRGVISARKVGKHWRYRAGDVRNYLEGSQKSAAPETVSGSGERRQNERLNCEIPVLLQTVLKRRGQSIHRGTIYNLSAGGLLFVNEYGLMKDAERIQVGDPLKIAFSLPEGPAYPVEAEGRVVHRRVNGSVYLGIKFKNLNAGDHELIEKFVG